MATVRGMQLKILVAPGDGIGPEIMQAFGKTVAQNIAGT